MDNTASLTFDDWNTAETTRICAQEGADVASHVRRARSGGFARVTLRDAYVDACRRAGVTPEPMFPSANRVQRCPCRAGAFSRPATGRVDSVRPRC